MAATKHMSSVLASESSQPIWGYKQYSEELCQAVCATFTRPWPPSRTELICLLVSYIMDFIMRICVCIRYSDLFFHPIFSASPDIGILTVSYDIISSVELSTVAFLTVLKASHFGTFLTQKLGIRNLQFSNPGVYHNGLRGFPFQYWPPATVHQTVIPTSSSQELQRKAEYRSLQ